MFKVMISLYRFILIIELRVKKKMIKMANFQNKEMLFLAFSQLKLSLATYCLYTEHFLVY